MELNQMSGIGRDNLSKSLKKKKKAMKKGRKKEEGSELP